MIENKHPRGKTFPAADLTKLLGASFLPALRLLLRPDTRRQWPTLLREGIDPIVRLLIQANNTALINRWLDQGTKVVFVSSFPRSGNTWMRFLLADILLQMHGVETTTELPVDPDDLIPEFRCDSIVNRLARCPQWAAEPPMAFIKTHVSFSRLEEISSRNIRQPSKGQSEGSGPLRDWRVLYLYRSPEDALVSFYHLCLGDVSLRGRTAHGLDAFCQSAVARWVENISSHFRAADDGFPVYFVSYEQLLEKPAIVLGNALRWLGLPDDIQMVERAVSNMQFEKLQAMERQRNKTGRPDDEQKLM